MLAPIVLFVYNRPQLTEYTLRALSRSSLSQKSTLYIYSDGPKIGANEEQLRKINDVRSIIKSNQWCGEVIIREHESNLGLANSVIKGVSNVLNQHGKVIVLEDDIIVGKGFLEFMNDSLEMYENHSEVAGVSGFCYYENIKNKNFFLPIGCSWSWGTWKRVWDHFIPEATEILDQIDAQQQKHKFDFGSYPFYKMLQDQSQEKVDSWAIRFYGSFFLKKQYFLYPYTSLVSNKGFGAQATHTKSSVALFEKEAFDGNIAVSNITVAESQSHILRTEKAFISSRQKQMTKKNPNMIGRIKNKLNSLRPNLADTQHSINKLSKRLDALDSEIKFQNGILLSKQQNSQNITKISDAEFKVYSQWGDDGIIQFLINNVEIKNPHFVEFGVENYLESNTRFLLRYSNWSGLVIDGSSKHIESIRSHREFWQHDLRAVHSFITAENINQLLSSNGAPEDLGILSIDVDGNDYWIWKAITVVQPRIVIVEYNAVFGPSREITIPYSPDFVRSKAHFSHLYFGASLAALSRLGKEKGYALIGCNSAGNNAYFLRNDCLSKFTPLDPYVAFNLSKFRESRDEQGKLNFMSNEDRYACIKKLPVVNVTTGQTEEL